MAQHFGGAPDVHGLLLLCCAVSMFSLSLVATVEVGTVEVGTVQVGTVQVRTVSDVSYVQWAVDEFSLSQVYFSLIWVWVLGAEMGQIPVESSLSSSFVLVYAGAESKSKVLHSCQHWKSHILTIQSTNFPSSGNRRGKFTSVGCLGCLCSAYTFSVPPGGGC